MTTPAPTAEPTPSPNPGELDDAELQQSLRILLDAGTKLVQELAADPTRAAADKAEPFERYARAIRRTVAMARHVAENPTKRAPSAAERRTQARRETIRDVEHAIVRAERPEQVETLCDELNERLDDPEFERELATRPLADIIRDLKRDLGLESPYLKHPRRTPADIRDLNARAAAPCKPKPDPKVSPDTPADPASDAPEFEYEPGTTRTNPLLTRYREAADG